ncbi:hypothetical protein Ancab_006119 [Ancistrocladus abbreviatus]
MDSLGGEESSTATIQANNQFLNEEEEQEACLHAMQLSLSYALPAVLNAATELGIFDIISKAANHQISAAEIAAHLPTTNPKAASVIDRMLHLLSTFSLLTCTSCRLDDGSVKRLYGLAPAGKFFVKDKNGNSYIPCGMFAHHRPAMEKWYYLKDAVLEDIVPFEKARGMSFFQYANTDPVFNKVFNKAMAATTTINMKKMLQVYRGFEGVKVLVDVGGGVGAFLNLIISKYPSIRGINFDLPHVVKDAPSYPGIEHVGGDMFEGIPKADAIFMKSILHDWDDEKCLKLLKNCYQVLEEKGKVIVVTSVMPEAGETSSEAKYVTQLDMMMLANFGVGRERTQNELKALAKAAGFQCFQPVCSVHANWIIELYK